MDSGASPAFFGKKIDAMTYAIALLLKAIGPEDAYYKQLFELRNTWLIRGGTERMSRTGINPFTGRPLDVPFPRSGLGVRLKQSRPQSSRITRSAGCSPGCSKNGANRARFKTCGRASLACRSRKRQSVF